MSKPVAVVTGASRGIGKQLCIDLAAAGYDVVCVARSTASSPSKLAGTIEETANLVEKQGGRALLAPLDVRDEAGCAALADRVLEEFGRCDALINNAALAPPKPALEDTIRRWVMAVDVNVNGPFYLIYHFAGRMAQGKGHIVNVSSAASIYPEFGRPSYTTTKAALDALSLAMAHELKGRLAVNSIRIDIPIWSEGFGDTLPEDTRIPFEHPVIMSDLILWLLAQPIETTGRILSLRELRKDGTVRPETLMKDHPEL